MRIALLSFEFPPSVAIGGIGAYAAQAAALLARAGHTVVVFAAGREAATATLPDGVTVHRIVARDRAEFAPALVPKLREEDARQRFDLIEAPEIGPEGADAFAALPHAARVVKLHTPSYLVRRAGDTPASWTQRLRFLAGALRRGRWQTIPTAATYVAAHDPERSCALLADEIAAPCRAIADEVGREWSLPEERLSVFPLPHEPPSALLALPPPERIRTIAFLGRLEPRKGVLELAAAIPEVLRAAPHLRFRFIGPSWPFQSGDMRAHLERQLRRHLRSVEFSGAVTPAQLPDALGDCDAVVLPSRWENFPYACWESLAAARVVIGSSAGGMADVIEPGRSGHLVSPRRPDAIAAAVLGLVQAPGTVRPLALAGRARVQDCLAPARILPLQLASYERARAFARLRLSA